MVNPAFQEAQLLMARYLRDPEHHLPPQGVEERRLKVYQELIYNNIEGFISGGFPVLRSLYADADWHSLVRTFIDQHRCQTPYFLQISEEFLQFLLQDFQARPCDPPFIAELAHYEWAELALDISEAEVPAAVNFDDVLRVVPHLSPLAWSLRYQFPVHRIGPGFAPGETTGPVYLVVYRNREDTVKFMELNETSARLLELVSANDGDTAAQLLERLAGELALSAESVRTFGAQLLVQLVDQAIVTVEV